VTSNGHSLREDQSVSSAYQFSSLGFDLDQEPNK